MPKHYLASNKTEPKIEVDAEYERRINFPVNEEILEGLQIGDSVVVTLEGKVEGMNSHQSSEYSDQSMTVVATSVEVYPGEPDEEEDAFQTGFGKGHSDRY